MPSSPQCPCWEAGTALMSDSAWALFPLFWKLVGSFCFWWWNLPRRVRIFIQCRHLVGPFNSFGNSWASNLGNFLKLSLGVFLPFLSCFLFLQCLYWHTACSTPPLTTDSGSHCFIFLLLFLGDFFNFIIQHFWSKFLKWNIKQ